VRALQNDKVVVSLVGLVALVDTVIYVISTTLGRQCMLSACECCSTAYMSHHKYIMESSTGHFTSFVDPQRMHRQAHAQGQVPEIKISAAMGMWRCTRCMFFTLSNMHTAFVAAHSNCTNNNCMHHLKVTCHHLAPGAFKCSIFHCQCFI